MTDNLPALVAASAVLVAAIVSPWVAFLLSLRRFRRDRSWEREAQAYDSVIEALYRMKEILDYDLDSVARGRDVPDEVEAAHLEQYRCAKRQIIRAVQLGAYLMGADARARLQRYLLEMNQSGTAEPWFESLALGAAATSECLQQVIEIARRDLGHQSLFECTRFAFGRKRSTKNAARLDRLP